MSGVEELVNFDLEVRMAKKDWIGTPAEPYYMNPEKCRELVEKHGGRMAAAQSIGVATKTSEGAFRRWLNLYECREYDLRYNMGRGRLRHRRWYESLSGREYNKRLLKDRRRRALNRMAERNKRREAEYGSLQA